MIITATVYIIIIIVIQNTCSPICIHVHKTYMIIHTYVYMYTVHMYATYMQDIHVHNYTYSMFYPAYLEWLLDSNLHLVLFTQYMLNTVLIAYMQCFWSLYGAPLPQRASYLALHSSLFGPVTQLIMILLSLTQH